MEFIALFRSLRVRPGTSCGITELSQHEPDGGGAQEGERFAIEVFKVLGKPAAPAKPSESSFNDSAFEQDNKSLGLIAALDDFDPHAGKSFLRRPPKLRALVASICVRFSQNAISSTPSRP